MRTTTLLGAGLLALSAGAAVFAAAPAAGTEMRQETKNDADDAQKKSDKIVYWVLDASGKGWSAGKKARAAIDDVLGDSIDSIFMSGTVATFTLKKDAKLDLAKLQTSLPAALKKNKITFNGLTMKTGVRAKAAYVLETPGLTWSDTASKVRATLADALDGGKVTEIFVGTQVILHVSDEDYEPDADDILAALKKHKQKAKGDLERDDDCIL